MRKLSTLLLPLLLAAPLAAQTPAPPAGQEDLVDRVVAVVGDTVVLYSDIQFDLQSMQASGRPIPQDPVQLNALLEQMLESRVNDLVLLQAAKAAGITVSDEEINQQVDEQVRRLLAQYRGNEQAFTAALAQSGMTREQYRQTLANQFREQQMTQTYLQREMRSRAKPVISEEQVRAFFDEQKGALGTRPATVSFQQVVVTPTATDSAKAAARRQAEDVLRQLREGGDFEVLARRFSDDPGSKEHGGDLGWFKRGRMVPQFEEAAFAMRPGQTSGIVESDYGYHIIRVDKTRAAERSARHILITPEVTPADVERARHTADSLVTAIRGGAPVTELARKYKTPSEEADVARAPVDRLPPEYTTAIGEATAGQVVGPVELQGPRGAQFAVIKVTDRQPAGEYTVEDVHDQIVERLQQQQIIEQLVKDLRGGVHVAILR